MATLYFTACSLDGFIADEEATLSWLLTRQVDGQGPMGYERFIARIGALVMGRTTYDWVRRHEPDSWSYEVPCWVLTHRGLQPPPGADVRATADDAAAVHAQAVRAAGGKDVWLVGGGELVGQFADAGLLDELWVQYAPVTLGRGAPLLPRRLELRLEELAQNGELACARYAVVR